MSAHSSPFLFRLLLGVCMSSLLLSGCSLMPTSGASRKQVQTTAESSTNLEGITLVNVDDALTRRLMAGKKKDVFSEVFNDVSHPDYAVGPGDVIEITIWETPPSMLFGGIALSTPTGAVTTRGENLPSQMVMEDGKVSIPFVGRVNVAGRSVHEIETDIAKGLQGQANHPQVMVRISKSNSYNVTIIGDVNKSALLPLTPKGERLLDALAAAGGVTQPVTRVALQLSRQDATAVMPLDSVIRDPRQNIPLMPGDVITALFQPQSFTVLGATGKNQEVPFEAQGISLAQALARSGGLNDNRADPQGVFIFRFEKAAMVADAEALPAADGTVPVIYQVNFTDPAAFFVTQNFPVENNDVLYVANAPSAELEKFLRMIGQVLTPTMSITRIVQTATD